MQRRGKKQNKKSKPRVEYARLSNCKKNTLGIIEISEGEDGVEEILEVIVANNFSILMAGRKPQIQEPRRTSSKINTK